MEGISTITSQKRTVLVLDENDQRVPRKVNVWNPTVANLTLMALGSSAPEILLSVLETVTTLGSTPGELGPSTIVGSAAFNFLVISGVSIYSVTVENDTRDDKEIEEDKTKKGVKKVLDMGVFSVTTIFSVFAYVWLYYCLMDGEVTSLEAWLTFAFFWILIIIAFIFDRINQARRKANMDKKLGKEGEFKGAGVTEYDVSEFYNTLINEKIGEVPLTK